jgi:hypothetical protein
MRRRDEARYIDRKKRKVGGKKKTIRRKKGKRGKNEENRRTHRSWKPANTLLPCFFSIPSIKPASDGSNQIAI